MLKVWVTYGLPASGKTTWTKAKLAEKPNSIKRINKDDLRAMLDDRKYSPDSEKLVLKMRDVMILTALEHGKHVVIDDTNLNPKHISDIRDLVKGKAVVKVVDFTNISVEECLERDSKRTVLEQVGKEVILKMWGQFLKDRNAVEPMVVKKREYNSLLSDAIICDADGTLCLHTSRGPFEMEKCGEDSPNQSVIRLVAKLKQVEKCKLIIVTGREEKFKDITSKWMLDNGINFDSIFTRPTDDFRKDDIIKEEIYKKYIENKFNVLYVIDDRLRTCRMWYKLGLPLFRVGDPDASF